MSAHSVSRPSTVHRSRLFAAAVLLTIGFAVLGWRLFAIQVMDHTRWLESAKAMRRSMIATRPRRVGSRGNEPAT